MVIYCKSCWTPSTRPRITFNSDGVCNACQWAETKKTIDWNARLEKFLSLGFDEVLVPWSGGKDSIYVTYKMKELGINPHLITVIPHMELPIGKWNRQNMCHTFPHIEINLKEDKYRELARKYFVEDGRPKHPWETAISAVILDFAIANEFKLIMYGEEGEAEYGGDTGQLEQWCKPVTKEYLMKYYWQGGKVDWKIPEKLDVFFTQWSRWDNWSPDKHAHFAVAKGMRTEPIRNMGTFSSTSQLSDKLQDLHTYLMFLKFGFGRCTSDVSIGMREGWITREQGLDWIEKYDGEFLHPYSLTNCPSYYKNENSYLMEFLDYFQMTRQEFAEVLNKHANKTLLYQVDDMTWKLKPEIKEQRRLCL